MTADLVSRLRVHADRDNCVSHDWGGDYHDAGEDCVQAANEIERLLAENARLMHDIEAGSAEIARLRAWRARMVAIPSPSSVCGLLGCQNLRFHVHDIEQDDVSGDAK